MASRVVVDSGILLTSALLETLAPQAEALMNQWTQYKVQLAAPILFRYEVVAVTRKAVYQNRISLVRGLQIRDFLLTYPVELHFDEALLKRAYELASTHNRPTTYDSQYLAVAERLGCDFWTADERLFNAVSPVLSWVKWLGNFTPTP